MKLEPHPRMLTFGCRGIGNKYKVSCHIRTQLPSSASLVSFSHPPLLCQGRCRSTVPLASPFTDESSPSPPSQMLFLSRPPSTMPLASPSVPLFGVEHHNLALPLCRWAEHASFLQHPGPATPPSRRKLLLSWLLSNVPWPPHQSPFPAPAPLLSSTCEARPTH